MPKQLTEWNKFVQKIYKEGKAKDSNYQFKQALADASKRKSEMKHGSKTPSSVHKKHKSHKRKSKSLFASLAGGKRTRHRRRH